MQFVYGLLGWRRNVLAHMLWHQRFSNNKGNAHAERKWQAESAPEEEEGDLETAGQSLHDAAPVVPRSEHRRVANAVRRNQRDTLGQAQPSQALPGLQIHQLLLHGRVALGAHLENASDSIGHDANTIPLVHGPHHRSPGNVNRSTEGTHVPQEWGVEHDGGPATQEPHPRNGIDRRHGQDIRERQHAVWWRGRNPATAILDPFLRVVNPQHPEAEVLVQRDGESDPCHAFWSRHWMESENRNDHHNTEECRPLRPRQRSEKQPQTQKRTSHKKEEEG
mmetsp:Transcript_6440/g.17937  ORF Transcript_6440/g.17937 Transcript_6440/m.17937 type:complete len:278 (-) Transcript_6440:216-1049(-)